MADLLLDYTIFVDYQSGNTRARGIIERIISGETTAAISPMTVFHIWSGSDFDRRSEISFQGMLTFLEEAPLTVEMAKQAGMWIVSMTPSDRGKFAYFAFLSATAKLRGESICSRNAEAIGRFYSDITTY